VPQRQRQQHIERACTQLEGSAADAQHPFGRADLQAAEAQG
jgi:hypothetical protein